MTGIIECRNLSKEYGNKKVLDNINLIIECGEKIGIVGCNGAGKSTLAHILSGKIDCTEGKVITNGNIGYMEQEDYEKEQSTLSGGEKTRKKLKRIFYGGYNVLVLDEPTNHLDYKGVEWLIKKINNFKGTAIIISHDRYFLDKTVKKIIEIEDSKAVIFNGNYTFYRNTKKELYKNNLHLYMEQEKMKEKINEQINKLGNWSDKAHKESAAKAIETGNKFGGKEHNRVKAKRMDKAIKSRIKRLQRIEVGGLKKPKEEKSIFFEVNEFNKGGSVIIRAADIRKSFDGKLLFHKSSFCVKNGEKIGVYGVNGCGKTTLIKALLNKGITLEGTLYMNSSIKIGYISQEFDEFNSNLNILEFLQIKSLKEMAEMRTKLSLLGFEGEELKKPVNVLSSGEKMKLKILSMIKNECGILIFDEPTNHIDLHVREQLEEVMKSYNGTIILATHDRYMMSRVCNKLLVFKENKILRYEYGINEYLEHENRQKNNTDEQKLLNENRMAYLISALSCSVPGSEEYIKLDNEYKELIKSRA